MQLRRARGRAAQRRYRYRKEQALAETQARNEKLEAIVEGFTKALLGFGDHVMKSKAAALDRKLGFAYCDVVKTCLGLAARANEDQTRSEPNSQTPVYDENLPTSTVVSRSPDVKSSPLSTSDASQSAEPFNETSDIHKVLTPSPTASRCVLPGITFMFTQNPLLASDYSVADQFSYPEPSLWRRLLRHAVLRSYRALDRANGVPGTSHSWLARSHYFTLRHAPRWQLLILAKLGLESMAQEARSRVYGPSLPAKFDGTRLFNTDGHRILANAVAQDLERAGIWSESEMLRPEDLEGYIATKGTFSLDGNTLELQLFSSKASTSDSKQRISAEAKLQTVIIDTEKFIWKISEDAICLGDGMCFPKRIVNNAIVYSAVHMSQHI